MAIKSLSLIEILRRISIEWGNMPMNERSIYYERAGVYKPIQISSKQKKSGVSSTRKSKSIQGLEKLENDDEFTSGGRRRAGRNYRSGQKNMNY
jgi:hypothetical protein